MQPALNKPASPSISMSLPAGLERDKSRQRDLLGTEAGDHGVSRGPGRRGW